MPDRSDTSPTIGIIGFGAFGQLIARHLRPYFRMCAHDPVPGLQPIAEGLGVALTGLDTAARCPVVVLATPVGRLQEIVEAVAPHIRPGTLVLDVGSVKRGPAEIMKRGLPEHAEIVATHPLFGPQSARNGIAGLKIAICPIRGRRCFRLAAFLRHRLRLDVIMTTPEDHDREAATVQGLTHLIAKVLVQMEPLPKRMTTKSFDLLLEAVNMVRHDAPEVFQAIERANPYSSGVRKRFFELASALNADLADGAG
ncbi:prephenate dehydrogenase [Mesorhizobium sp. CN2-181]|uniref:prephenate dehydrogenase n=1 Tax=Mesorhizobium yinganensis TaxID=3157707 RepID=UPI0032B86529